MNQNQPRAWIQELAGNLLAQERSGIRSVDSVNSDALAASRICEKLRIPLSTLAGPVGFQALLARALTVARMETRTLSTVQVKGDGRVIGLEQVPSGEATQAANALVSHLINLLVTFIGEFLTLRLLRGIWSELPGNQLGGSQTT